MTSAKSTATGPSSGPEVRVNVRALELTIGVPINAVECRASADRSTHALERVDVLLCDGRRLDLVLKGTREPRSAVAFRRPSIVRDPLREAWAYRTLLDDRAVSTPRCYGVMAEGTPDERLVLETVPGRPLAEWGEREPWCDAARWLARFHAWGLYRPGSIGSEVRLLRQSAALHRQWWHRAVRARATAGHFETLHRLRAIRREYARAVLLLSRTPAGLVHGEFYPSNILVEQQPVRRVIRPVDWESVGSGPIVLDLAALTMGDWSPGDRAAITEAYGGVLSRLADGQASDGPSVDALALVTAPASLAAACLVNALQWLGWSEEWRAPDWHARDWLAEAEEAARDLRESETPAVGDISESGASPARG